MRTHLEHLTDAALAERLAKLEAMGKSVATRIANGERGNGPGSPYVHNGQWRIASHLENNLNVLRSAWKQTKREIDSRT